MKKDDSTWRQYWWISDQNAETQPSFELQVAFQAAKFHVILSDTIRLYYLNEKALITAQEVLVQLMQYLVWKKELPESIAHVDS